MSLLEGGGHYEPCEVYLEEVTTDEDGNTITRASATPTPAVARFQLQGQSGTSARLAEQQDEGFSTERVYVIRFPRSFPYVLGAQSKIKWDDQVWSVFGDIQKFNSSPRTAHATYTIKRS